jgi:hypothetical protein
MDSRNLIAVLVEAGIFVPLLLLARWIRKRETR